MHSDYRLKDGERFAPTECQIFQELVVKQTKETGSGLFAASPIRAGEVIAITGGQVLSSVEDLPQNPAYAEHIGEHLFLAPRDFTRKESIWYMNHACDSNVKRVGGLVNVAKRDIASGEELTTDYAPLVASLDESEVWRMECRCPSPRCRKKVTSLDWKNQEIAALLFEEWLPFIQKAIVELESETSSSLSKNL